jgi:hypothetical protein
MRKTAITGLAVIAAAVLPSSSNASVRPTRSASSFARAIALQPGQIVSARWVKLPPHGVPAAISSTRKVNFPRYHPTFGVLSSGDARGIARRNTSGSTSHDNGGAVYRGTRDTVTLRVDVRVPQGANCLSVRFRFLSDEFPEYVHSEFNDGFLAEIDHDNWHSPKNNPQIVAPSNFAFDWKRHLISVNGTGNFSVRASRARGTTFDAAGRVLRASKSVTPGIHRIYLTIFDQGDRQYDSAVALDGLGAAKRLPCRSGAALYS